MRRVAGTRDRAAAAEARELERGMPPHAAARRRRRRHGGEPLPPSGAPRRLTAMACERRSDGGFGVAG
jgi:hypothetical protein